ncbi:MAG: anaerobic ribonucleoside-triphosphate reductase activating protein [Erysipelotrichaceae bacterium]|nr:anaerobic ribonucleoside-triphosphate reductase activating protein [Erysipelotrichaceae bacterium]
MQQLSEMADIDKGTTTKSIRKLIDENFVEIRTDENDKRVKRIYTTKKAAGIINDLYRFRNDYVNQLMKGLDEETINREIGVIEQITQNAREIVPDDSYSDIKIAGLQKLTLLDYPGQVACTIFTAGCNMKCPFCHNKDLVFIPENSTYEDPDDIIEFLAKRRGIIDAVCITGGEPTLQAGLIDFIRQIKEMGYKVKVDTNGLNPTRLKQIVESGYVDYIAMDVKNSLGKYALTAGVIEADNLQRQIKKSINYLLSDVIDYEFRTTVVRQFHTKEDLIEIARMIRGAKHYYLQQFVDSGRCIEEGFTAYSKDEMQELCDEVRKIIPEVQLRGV